MLYLVFPLGNNFGWGVCGKYLAKELAKITATKLLANPDEMNKINDELDHLFLKSVFADREAFATGLKGALPEPVIQAIMGHNLLPIENKIKGKPNIGYTFFEHSFLPSQSIEDARQIFDIVVAGSSWCENVLKQHGLQNTGCILQGVDRTIFNACENQKTLFDDKFVIFSGGKLEFRKGQDLVIRAFKVLQDKYDDVLLVNSWFNPWSSSMQTMSASPYIHFKFESDNYFQTIENLLLMNGIDPKNVVTLPPKPNVAMASIYKNTDCGLFPNRCEGGTNLVLMEYLACGKPAIVSNSSGHRDVANEHNALMLKRMKSFIISNNGTRVAEWDDPNIDEIIDRLDWAYNNRTSLATIGDAAGKSMEKFSWKSAAEQFNGLTYAV
ncbi:MAG: glycosyltransferase family 1 protein [Planctomycetaceae bacterium]|nr:MAG: glycosyltransferase family 1 protein [Planctomycetaceae bacterium]